MSEFFLSSTITFEELFKEWLIWRKNTGTREKTLLEQSNEWKRYVAKNPIAKMKLTEIEASDIEEYFLYVTKDRQMTQKCFSNIRSTFRMMYKYALFHKYVTENIVDQVNYNQFRNRWKVKEPAKEIYSGLERQQILSYLEGNTEVYALAIQLAFFLPLRIGELTALKYEDMENGMLHIRRSKRKIQPMNDDGSFGPYHYEVVDCIKGNTIHGFRTIPLTDAAIEIIEITKRTYPDNEYLFMKNENLLHTDSFDKALKRVCRVLNIKYRSSHQIRFTTATMLHSNGMPINELSKMLGHSDVLTTWHYIRQSDPSPEAINIMRRTFS